MLLAWLIQISLMVRIESQFEALIPKAVSAEKFDGDIVLNKQITILAPSRTSNAAENLKASLDKTISAKVDIRISGKCKNTKRETCIQLRKLPPGNAAVDDKEGSYHLSTLQGCIRLEAKTDSGLFYGVQTLRQLLPVKANSAGQWSVPHVKIVDTPRFNWRGMMLDVARHWFPIETVKLLVDRISHYKANRLHLHLTDDQGWRLEINGYPNLTTIGSQSAVNGDIKGKMYYSLSEYSDLVEYAAARYVTIIPEFDMPGHTNAALHSVPELNSKYKSASFPYEGIDVGFSSFNITNNFTYTFISDVLKETSAVTAGSYIHIGGDESLVTTPEEYQTFMVKVAHNIVPTVNKTMVGWEEIVKTPVGDNGTLFVSQLWKPNQTEAAELANLAVAQGGKVIASPAGHAYLDMKYNNGTKLGLSWAGYVDVQKSYDWDPVAFAGVDEEHVLGVEACLWTETIVNQTDIDFMMFPRFTGHAEIAWSSKVGRNWTEYRERLAKHGLRLGAENIDFYRSTEVDWSTSGLYLV